VGFVVLWLTIALSLFAADRDLPVMLTVGSVSE